MSNLIADELQACADQAIWMENSIYQWESYPTVPKSKYKGTCVTYNACVLQRIGVLQPGQYIWHNPRGQVIGPTTGMTIYHPNKTPGEFKSKLLPGDILMDGNKADTDTGSHIFIISGRWDGIYPYVWDNHSAQQQLGEYKYTRNRNVFAVVRLDAVLYEPRLNSDGMLGSPYYYSLNPFYNAGYGLPNCTAYAWGRFWEVSDTERSYTNPPSLSTGNAEDWYGHTADGYERGTEPQLGAVICFADGPFSGDGHVAIVEVINEDGSIVTSNSAWGGEYFYTQTLYPPNYLPASGYVFQGFIYNPNGGWWPGPGPGPYPTFIQKPWLWKRELYNREEFLIR